MSESKPEYGWEQFSISELHGRCAVVSDKLNNLLTAIQIRTSLLLKQAHNDYERHSLLVILQASSEAASYSNDLHILSVSGSADSSSTQ